MSRVTGIVLCTSCNEEDGSAGEDGKSLPVERIDAWLAERGFEALFMAEDHFPGAKHPQMKVGIGGYNYLEYPAFVDFVLALPWRTPEAVVLVVNSEDYAPFTFRPADAPIKWDRDWYPVLYEPELDD